MAENERTELMEIERAVEACNAVAVPNPVRLALVRDLGPVAARLAHYSDLAALPVATEIEATTATQICNDIAADIKTVREHEVLSKITDGLHQLHKKWTGLRDLFITPMERDRRTLKGKIIAWQTEEARKAAVIQARMQAEADAKAARERERVEAEARRQREIEDTARRQAEDARRQAEAAQGAERDRLQAAANAADRRANAAAEKAEVKSEQVAAVIAPTVTVKAPKSDLRTAKAWVVKNIDPDAFFRALASRPDLRGYVEINQTRLARAKAANPSAEIPGVVFEQIIR